MIAYYVHSPRKENDIIVIPEMAMAVPVDRDHFQEFISASPVFARWSGETCGEINPDQFGTVLATRDEAADVCVLEGDLWQARMAHYLGEVKPDFEKE
jgi:hypothetical protein